ncbi:MAG: VTC domain-containing protein [Oscillospiraceae bacterium]
MGMYKRRVALSLQAELPSLKASGLRWTLKFCGKWIICTVLPWIPTAYIAYQRVALYGLEDANLRVTFDWNLRWRCENLHLDAGTEGQLLLPEGQFLMEIKVPQSNVVWMARLLDSFCKYFTFPTCVGEAIK